ncbi:MAG: ribosome small subunit-dependent GTPase A [Clostridia bacterium]|nr:ribosome small subunit-dependent GTPase A [Clostridia bacterium]
MIVNGIIVKSIADLYEVKTENGILPCKARGLFRKSGVTPLVGDRVTAIPTADGEGRIEEILPRKNFMERPSVANIDRLYLIVSATDPAPVPLMIDRLTALAFEKEIQPVLVLTKTDLADVSWLIDIYKTVPMPIITACAATGHGCDALKESLSQSGISVLTGNSGVGKSSLLNRVDPNLALATGETSKKLGRGKHTTRHTALYALGEGLVADTPGFSSLDMERVMWIYKENLVFDFPEFLPFAKECRFADCKHVGEKDCGVATAVQSGQVSQSRLDSYRLMYKEADAIKDWQRKK